MKGTSTNKRVLFLINYIPPDYGGGYLRVFRTATRFKQYGWFYKVATYTQRERYSDMAQGIISNDIFFLKNNFLSKLFGLGWKMILHSSDYDALYIASARWHTVIPTLIARMQGKVVVNSVTLSMVDSPALAPNVLYKAPYYWYKNLQFWFANFIFVNSPLLVDECRRCGLSDDRIKLINNPVDLNTFHPISLNSKKALRNELGIEKDLLTILFIGSINNRKGCNLLPEIFRKLFLNVSFRVNFIICGQKGYPESLGIIKELNEIFKEHGSNLLVQEEVVNPANYYQLADVFLFPTTNEGMPNVILEAMASGNMIICNKLPGITDYVLGSEFLVDNNKIDEIVKRLLDYQTEPERFEVEIKKNRTRIEGSFSIDSVDSGIKEILSY